MKKRYILSLIFYFAIGATYSQDIWKPLDGPDGVDVIQNTVDYYGNMYVCTKGKDRVFRSTDNGVTWQSFNNGLNEDNSIRVKFVSAPDSSLYLYRGKKLSVLRPHSSIWENLNIPSGFCKIRDFSINPNGDLYLAGDKDVFRSIDKGQTFKNIFNAHNIIAKLSTNGDNKNFMIVGDGFSAKLFSFDDNGGNLKKLKKPSEKIKGIVYDSDSKTLFLYSAKGLYFTNDFGENWNSVNGLTGADTYYVAMLSSELFYCYNKNGLFLSKNKGLSWKKVQNFKVQGCTGIINLALLNDGRIFLLKEYGQFYNCKQLYITNKDFNDFTELQPKIIQPVIHKLSKDSNGDMYATLAHERFLKSKDEWDTWEEISLKNENGYIISLGHDYVGNIVAVSEKGRVYISINGGKEWRDITPNLNSFESFAKVFVAPDGEIFLLSTFNKLYVSKNRGNSWEISEGDILFFESDFNFHTNGDVYLKNTLGVYKSEDDGISWEKFEPFNRLVNDYKFQISNTGNILYCINDFGVVNIDTSILVKIKDNIIIDVPLPLNTSYVLDIDETSDETIFIITNKGIFMTKNDGVDWIDITYNLSFDYLNGIFIDLEDNIYILPKNNRIYKKSGVFSYATTKKEKLLQIIISPQPFDYRTKIVVDDIDLSKKNIFTVFNNFGQKVFDKKIDSDEFYFYRNNLPQGIYFYNLKNVKGIAATGKLVIQ